MQQKQQPRVLSVFYAAPPAIKPLQPLQIPVSPIFYIFWFSHPALFSTGSPRHSDARFFPRLGHGPESGLESGRLLFITSAALPAHFYRRPILAGPKNPWSLG